VKRIKVREHTRTKPSRGANGQFKSPKRGKSNTKRKSSSSKAGGALKQPRLF
jgi:hypothetical protein